MLVEMKSFPDNLQLLITKLYNHQRSKRLNVFMWDRIFLLIQIEI